MSEPTRKPVQATGDAEDARSRAHVEETLPGLEAPRGQEFGNRFEAQHRRVVVPGPERGFRLDDDGLAAFQRRGFKQPRRKHDELSGADGREELAHATVQS